MSRFDKFEASLAEKLPGFKVDFKDESTLMKLIGMILFFNKAFMTGFITTIGYTVYWPDRESLEKRGDNAMSTLAHEYRHAKDAEKYTRPLFGFLYLLPQLLAAPGILSALIMIPLLIFSVISWSWWMLPLMLSALLVAPLPAYFRMKFEVNGYMMSLFMLNELLKEDGIDKDNRKIRLAIRANDINKNFTGPNYYFMWPFGVEERLLKASDKILNEDMVNEHEIYQDVLAALKESKA